MSKTILYLVILAILGFAVWFFLFSDKSGDMFRSRDAAFTIRDTGSVGKIFLSSNAGGPTITLERKEEGWLLNGKYAALPSAVTQLLLTLRAQTALYPITDADREGIIRNLAGNGIKVEVYDRGGDRMRTFYVGGELNKFVGTAMLMEGSERPYAVNVAGFEGYLTPRYTPEVSYWRERLVFDIAPERITQVSVRYPQEPLNSFTLTQSGGKVAVRLDSALKLGTPLNEQRAKAYLGFFTRVYCEAFMTSASVRDLDSTVRSMPVKALIDVQGDGGYHKAATLIYYPIDYRSKNVGEVPTTFDDHFNNERYFGIINGGADTLTIQLRQVEKILRRGYEFYTPGADAPDVGPPVPGLPGGIAPQK